MGLETLKSQAKLKWWYKLASIYVSKEVFKAAF